MLSELVPFRVILRGCGGIGKSKLLHALENYLTVCCKHLKRSLDDDMMVVMMVTPNVAKFIMGLTVHEAVGVSVPVEINAIIEDQNIQGQGNMSIGINHWLCIKWWPYIVFSRMKNERSLVGME